MSPSRPNLLFLMTDHQRADSIGMVQAGVEVAPNLNRLAAEGTFFPRGYTTCPLCVPARTALATGQYPTRNGVVYNDWAGKRSGDHRPIHQVLAAAGYDVAHIGVHHIRVRPDLRERADFAKWASNAEWAAYTREQGFEETPGVHKSFQSIVRERVGQNHQFSPYSNVESSVWDHEPEHFKDLFFAREAADFLASRPAGKPFALFVYLWAPHPPLWVPEPYASLFDPDRLDLPPNVGMPSENEPPERHLGVAAQLGEQVPMEQWRRVWAAHLGLVRLADSCTGRILDALDQTGRSDDTFVFFTVDHGDHLGQHRMYQKMEMYEPAVRVPVIVRGPGVRPQVEATPISHLDLFPTILDALTLGESDAPLDGISLLPGLTGQAAVPERTLFSQYSGNPDVGDIRRAAITTRYKYVYDPRDQAELYDLLDDPLEMHNLAPDPEMKPIVRDLHEQTRRWHGERGDWVGYNNE